MERILFIRRTPCDEPSRQQRRLGDGPVNSLQCEPFTSAGASRIPLNTALVYREMVLSLPSAEAKLQLRETILFK